VEQIRLRSSIKARAAELVKGKPPKDDPSVEEYLANIHKLLLQAQEVRLPYFTVGDVESAALEGSEEVEQRIQTLLDLSDMLSSVPLELGMLDMLETYGIPDSWENLFREAINELVSVSRTLTQLRERGHRVVPNVGDIFRAFYLTPLPTVRVVIFGQDPYPQVEEDGTPAAMGLSFATRSGVKLKKSLLNIYKNLNQSHAKFKIPRHGDLTYWARQGVLLLNGSLTTLEGKPNQHGDLWKGFIVRVINTLFNLNKNTIFVFWGREAEKFRDRVLKTRGVCVIGPHTVARGAEGTRFLSTPFFQQIDEILLELKKGKIDWCLPEDPLEGYTKRIGPSRIVNFVPKKAV